MAPETARCRTVFVLLSPNNRRTILGEALSAISKLLDQNLFGKFTHSEEIKSQFHLKMRERYSESVRRRVVWGCHHSKCSLAYFAVPGFTREQYERRRGCDNAHAPGIVESTCLLFHSIALCLNTVLDLSALHDEFMFLMVLGEPSPWNRYVCADEKSVD